MSKLRTTLLAGVALLALAFVATAFGDDNQMGNTSHAGRHNPAELRVGNELGQQHEHEYEHVDANEFGDEHRSRESDRRSRWGRLELQHQLGRCRRGRDGHRNLDRNGWRVHLDRNQHVAADCNLDGVGGAVRRLAIQPQAAVALPCTTAATETPTRRPRHAPSRSAVTPRATATEGTAATAATPIIAKASLGGDVSSSNSADVEPDDPPGHRRGSGRGPACVGRLLALWTTRSDLRPATLPSELSAAGFSGVSRNHPRSTHSDHYEGVP